MKEFFKHVILLLVLATIVAALLHIIETGHGMIYAPLFGSIYRL